MTDEAPLPPEPAPEPMTGAEFDDALGRLGWRKADFSRVTGVNPVTLSRWSAGHSEVPPWVAPFLGALLGVKAVHDAFIAPGAVRRLERPRRPQAARRNLPTREP